MKGITAENNHKRSSGIKNVWMIMSVLLMIFVLPVSAAETENENEILMIENPGQTEEGETFLSSEEVLEQVEMKRPGTIEIKWAEEKVGVMMSGIRFYCIRVADIIGGEYKLLEEYQSSGIDFHEIENSNQLEKAAIKLEEIALEQLAAAAKGESAAEEEESATVRGESAAEGGESAAAECVSAVTDSRGCASFEDLKVGVYLIMAENNEAYDIVTPALVAVPTWNEAVAEMTYEILVEPKHTPRPDIPTEKEAPQTSLEDRTPLYAGAAGACVLLALVLILTGRKRDGT